MKIKLLKSPQEFSEYDHWLRTHPYGSLWQSLEWKKYQEALGRETKLFVAKEGNEIVASALVIIDRTTFGISTWEIPRGPIGPIDNEKLIIDNLLEEIIRHASDDHCLALFFSPLNPNLILNSQFSILNSNRYQHPAATRIIDLTKSEEEILAQMKPKGRYNIRVAQKHGVTIEESRDIDAFYELVSETTKRDKFTGHSKNHYQKFLDALDGSFLLFARIGQNKKPIAGLLGVFWGETGTYYYGASSASYRAVMAPYVLQWESMRLSKARGCTKYDFFGIAPIDAPNSHPWKGVSAFKEKFGGEVIEYPEEKVVVLKPVSNSLLKLKRKILS
ncbi:MAG: aminoacyltransferase [Kiritimatiellales bacterium]|nr:aminoacyltransferase [Kiritimatiellales bacterium]